MKHLSAFLLAVIFVLAGFITAPTALFADLPAAETTNIDTTVEPEIELEITGPTDSEVTDSEITELESRSTGSRQIHRTPEDFESQNVLYLISESLDTVPSGRYLDGIPLRSDGRDTILNKADLHLPNANTNPVREGYDEGNRMYYRFPRNPGQKYDANFNSSFGSAFINISFNTLQTPGKEIKIEVLIDANGDFDVDSPNMANIEGIIQFPLFTTQKPSPSPDVMLEETFESEGTWADVAFIPSQIRNGAIYLSLWREDNLFDPEVPFLPDCLVYAGFTNKTSWLALPYEHTVTLPKANASYDYYKDSVHKWFGIWEPPSKGMAYDDVPEWMKMKPYDTITFNASRSLDPNDDYNSNGNIDDGIPQGELIQADEVDTLQYKWFTGDGSNSGWRDTPIYQYKYTMDSEVKEKTYQVKLQVRNRAFHVVEDACEIRIFNEEHPPEISKIDILPQSTDPYFGTYGPRAVENQEVQFTGYASDKDPWDLNDLRYHWDLDGDDTIDETGKTVVTSYSSSGTYSVTLWVYDGDPTNSSTFSASMKSSIFISENELPEAKIIAALSGVAPVENGLSVQYNVGVLFNASLCYDTDELPGFDVSKPKDFVQDHNLSFRWHWNKDREDQTILDGLDPYANADIISPWTFNITTSHRFTLDDYISGNNYKVSVYLEADDGSDIVTSETFTITLNLRPIANFLINNKTEIQTLDPQPGAGDKIHFDASPSYDPNDDINGDAVIRTPEVDGMTYRWLFDDGTEAEGKIATHAFAEVGDHTITLIASDGELTGKKIRHLNIVLQGKPPIAVAEISKTSGTTHSPFSFKASNSYDLDPNDDVVKFHWDFGDGFTSSEADTTHSYSKDDLYDIILTVTDRTGRTDTNTEFSIHVRNREPIVILNLLGTGFTESPIKMTATAQDPDGEIDAYKWDFGDGTTIDWGNNSKPTHEYAKENTYTVIVWVRDDTGQTNMSSGVIKIDDIDDIIPVTPEEGSEPLLWLIVAIIATVIIITIVVIVMRIRRETL